MTSGVFLYTQLVPFFLSEAVSALQAVNSGRIGLKRELGDVSSATGTLPVALIHPPFKTASSAASSTASGISALLVAITALQVVRPRGIWFKRELGDGVPTIGACPVTLVHLPLEAASVSICHFAL